MKAAHGIDQLYSDPYGIAGSAHAAFEDRSDVQPVRNCRHVHILALEGKRGGSADDLQFLYVRKSVEQLFADAVGKILLLGIATHVHKGQYCDGVLRWSERGRCTGGLSRWC